MNASSLYRALFIRSSWRLISTSLFLASPFSVLFAGDRFATILAALASLVLPCLTSSARAGSALLTAFAVSTERVLTFNWLAASLAGKPQFCGLLRFGAVAAV